MKKFLLFTASMLVLTGCSYSSQVVETQKNKELDVIEAQKQKEIDVLEKEKELRAQEEKERQASIDVCITGAKQTLTAQAWAAYAEAGVKLSSNLTAEQFNEETDKACKGENNALVNWYSKDANCLKRLNAVLKSINESFEKSKNDCYARYK